ncbi:MAG: dihydroorotate dehydrogenase-like protein [Spirochaetia bacterium]|jgi:dihydroorotate dehydrogenase (fumarate)
MADLSTDFVGIKLKNPIIAGASGLTSNMDTIKLLEKSGVAALVCKSLFEEQIELEQLKFQADLHKNENTYSEMLDHFPHLEHAGTKEHLFWVQKTKEAVAIPVFASLNAVRREIWIDWGLELAKCGIDGLEINLYATPQALSKPGGDIEKEQIELVGELKSRIGLPLIIKLSPFYTNVLHFIDELDKAGADGFLLFNRLFQPDIDIEKEENVFPFAFSQRDDNRLPLRYVGLLYQNVKASLCAGTGIMQGEDVIKMILAGADVVQVVTTLYKNSIDHVGTMLKDIDTWLSAKKYSGLAQIKGKMSYHSLQAKDQWVYKRTQYVKMLMQQGDKLMEQILY